MRYSEKILEATGIAVEPIDLSEVLGRINRIADDDADVRNKLDEMHAYVQRARSKNRTPNFGVRLWPGGRSGSGADLDRRPGLSVD